MHADADLQNAFVQVADLTRRRAPQQLERLVLLEELARVELVDRLVELGGRWFGACSGEIGGLQTFECP
jgi:hypothetical protein